MPKLLSLAILDQLLGMASPAAEVASAPTDADFVAMVHARRREMHAITDRLIAKEINVDDWADLMHAAILEGHTKGWQLGRHLSGDLEDDLNDLLRGLNKADAEKYYLQGFRDALLARDPRYWDEELEEFKESIKSRQDLYLGKMRGTANEAFVNKSPRNNREFDWVLGGTEDHCEDCPEFAADSPWQADELFAYPGSGETQCKFNCLCHLVRSDGVSGFKPVKL